MSMAYSSRLPGFPPKAINSHRGYRVLGPGGSSLFFSPLLSERHIGSAIHTKREYVLAAGNSSRAQPTTINPADSLAFCVSLRRSDTRWRAVVNPRGQGA